MIRFRVGQSWKREPPGSNGPRDAFAFELDGVNLLVGANDEPLIRVIGNLVDAVAGLVVDSELGGQLSLEDVQLEVCFWRREGHEVELSVVSLEQPPKRIRPLVMLELPALVEATITCARSFLRDTAAWRDSQQAEVISLERRLKALAGSVVSEFSPPRRDEWTAVRPTDELGYTLRDVDGRTLAFNRRARAGLPCLLIDGDVSVGNSKVVGLPFLTMMGLARAATEGWVQFGGNRLDPEVVFSAGLDLCLALRARSPLLAGNPWLEALQVRCSDGLRALRKPVPDTSVANISVPRATPGLPIAAAGQVRRVALSPTWSRPVALGEEGGRLLLGRTGVVVFSAHAAHGFSPAGKTTFRRLSARGVAASATTAICALPERVMCFEGAAASASWLRDHDGSQLGPRLLAAEGVLLTTQARRGVIGFDALTGRELWRFDPPRTQRSWLSVIGSRALLSTDSGALFGLDVVQGAVRFTIRSSIPCAGPAVAWGRRALVVLNRGEHTPVFLCEVAPKQGTSGSVTWTRELLLASPRPPVVASGRAFLAGERDGRSVIVALGARGQVLWERSVPLDAQSLTLLPYDKGVLAGDAHGAAVRVLPDGQVAWVAGNSADQLGSTIGLALSRQVLVVPGPSLRLIDPASGRVLANAETGPRVTDVAVDKKLNIYVLKEPGVLELWKPGAVLAVV